MENSNYKIIMMIVAIVCVTIYMMFFKVNSSHFVCNGRRCEVTNQNMLRGIRSKEKVNISDIESFEISEQYRWSSKHNNSPGNRYDYCIIAKTKNGSKYKLFGASSTNSEFAERTINELNYAIQNPPVNIDLSY